MIAPGPRNLITDVSGLRVGNAKDQAIRTGVTVLTAEAPFTASVHVMGGAPGTRETELLAPDRTVERVDAIVLSGGSAFGLDAAQGVTEGLRAQGRGFAVHGMTVPIRAGRDHLRSRQWRSQGLDQFALSRPRPHRVRGGVRDLRHRQRRRGHGRVDSRTSRGGSARPRRCGTGIPSAHWSPRTPWGRSRWADGPHFHAAPCEFGDEFGGLGPAPSFDPARLPPTKLTASEREATAIAIVATDAALTKAQAARMATMAHDGIARAVRPSHAPMDGDTVFAVATGARSIGSGHAASVDLMWLGHLAALCLARAMARGIYHATPAPGDVKPAWRARFG